MYIELDLRQILSILWRRVWVLILFVALFSGITFSVSNWFITKRYSATVSMYVYNQENRTSANITTSDLQTSQKLVGTYIVILKSNSVLDQVSEQLDRKYSAADIRKMLTAASINETEAFSVTITNTDPEEASKIANIIAKVVPSEIKRVVKAGSVEVIDYAKVPSRPASPDTGTNTLIGGLAGLIIAVLLVVFLEKANTAVRWEDDLRAAFDIPVLGSIPRLFDGGR